MKLKPLGVAVLDAGGHLVMFQGQVGASFLRPQMSAGKAYGALSIGMGSLRLDAFARERPRLVSGFADVSGGRIVPVTGGVLVRDDAGEIIGAVGISRHTSDNVEACAIAGERSGSRLTAAERTRSSTLIYADVASGRADRDGETGQQVDQRDHHQDEEH